MRTLTTLLLFTYLIALTPPAYGDETRTQNKFLVVSETTIRPENNDQIDLELEIDKQLKKSIKEYLSGRGLTVAAPGDKPGTILAYMLKKVHNETARTKIRVGFRLVDSSGIQLFEDEVETKSGRGWEVCVRKAGQLIAKETQRILSKRGGESANMQGMAENALPPQAAANPGDRGGNAEQLREERKGTQPITSNKEYGLIIGAGLDEGWRTRGSSQHVSFEATISERMTLYGKAAYEEYTYHNATYLENGRGKGVELGFNHYVTHFSFKGLYWGLGIGRSSILGNWEDDPNHQAGTGREVFFDYNAHIGYKLPLNRNLVVNPQFQAGIISGHGNLEGYGTTGIHLNLGLSVGYTW